jgi:hypothetical protein
MNIVAEHLREHLKSEGISLLRRDWRSGPAAPRCSAWTR